MDQVDEEDSADDGGSWNVAVHPDGTRKAVTEATARRVWIASGGRCAFCGENLLVDEITGQPVMIGQLAHIVGATKKPGSPRGDHPLPVEQRSEAENLILLCYNQHHVIDGRSLWDLYDVESLRKIKREHEDRMQSLASMTLERSRTVLRLVGAIGDVPVQLSDTAVTEALYERERFPDYKLRGIGNEYEIDLRGLAGSATGAAHYWEAGSAQIDEKGEELRRAVASGLVDHVAVFALARIPFLVRLGKVLGEGLPVDLYPSRKTGEGGFGWSSEPGPVAFDSRLIDDGADDGRVAVIVSVSGTPTVDELPPEIRTAARIYEIAPVGIPPQLGLDRSQQTIDSFRSTWAALLSELETLPGVRSVALFAAVPATFAITMGRCLVRGTSLGLAVYDRSSSGDFEFAMEVTR